MKASLFTYKGKKYIAVREGTGKRKGMMQFKRVRRFLWWYYPTKEPAFWVDRSQYQKTPNKRRKKK